MVEFMKLVVEEQSSLTVEMRNLLSVAYKNVVGAKRASWRILSSLTMREERDNGNVVQQEICAEYMRKVEDELTAVCRDVLALLEDKLIGKTSADSDGQAAAVEAEVFYLKMAGDYYRYIAEISKEKGDDCQAAKDAVEKYDQATEMAKKNDTDGLKSTHPIRLGLALNFSVFYVRDAAGGRVFAHVPVPFSCLLPYRVPRPALLKEPL